MLVKDSDRLVVFDEEIKYAENQLQPHDTGHIHTAISWMKTRLNQLRRNLIMKLSNETREVLKNYSTINANLLVSPATRLQPCHK